MRIDPALITRNTAAWLETDAATHTLLLTLTRRVVSSETCVEETQTISYPATWFQALKQQYAPQWLLTRWPVRLIVHAIPLKVTRMCPHVDIPNDTGKHITFLLNETYA